MCAKQKHLQNMPKISSMRTFGDTRAHTHTHTHIVTHIHIYTLMEHACMRTLCCAFRLKTFRSATPHYISRPHDHPTSTKKVGTNSPTNTSKTTAGSPPLSSPTAFPRSSFGGDQLTVAHQVIRTHAETKANSAANSAARTQFCVNQVP